MKKFLKLLVQHWQEDFNVLYYSAIAAFLIIGLSINYSIELENKIIATYKGQSIRILWYFLVYATAYYVAVLIGCFTRRRSLRNYPPSFWWLSTIGLVLLSINSGFPYLYRTILLFVDDYPLSVWVYAVANNIIGFLLITAPLLLTAHYFEKKPREYFGITPAFDIRPYLSLLLIIVPLIAVSVFERGLGNYYPIYKHDSAAETLGWPKWLPMIVYELFYGLDFFNVEYIFRGFLVIGVSQIIGKEAVMPMVTTYCFLHFGKPVGEAVSSIFGGYILGVIALNTRSVWGGVMLHIAVAWTMELSAFLAKVVH